MATTGTKVPSIITIPPNVEPNLKRSLESVKEALEIRLGRRGDPRDRAITLRELIDSGLAKELLDNPFDPNAGVGAVDFTANEVTDVTIPPAPTGLQASGAFTTIVVSWNRPQFGNFAFAEIWRSTNNQLSNATRIDTTTVSVWSDPVDFGQTFYYWVRFVSTSGIEGPFPAFVSATTEADIGATMARLSEELSQLPGFSALQNDLTVVVDGVSSSLASALGTLDTSVATAQTAANNAQTAANNAQSTANSIVTDATRVIRSTSAPTTRSGGGALQAHDVWIDTDDNNQLYIRNSSNNGWEKARDASLVTLVNSINTTVSGNSTAISSAQSDIVTINSTNSSQATAITNLENTVNDTSTGVAATATALGTLSNTVTTQGTNISTNSTDITALENTVNHATTGVAATASALSTLQSTVTTQGNSITSASSDITTLQNALSGYTGSGAVSTAISGLQSQVTANDGDITSINSSVTSLTSSFNTLDALVDTKARTFVGSSAPTATAIGDLWIHTGQGNKLYRAEAVGADQITSGEWVEVQDDGIATNTTAISNLSTTVTTQGNSITSQATDITTLQNALSGYTGANAVSNAVTSLTNSITSNDGDITALNTSLTNLTSTVNTINGDYATNTALSSLSGTVTTQGNNISTNSTDITNLENTVNHATTGVAATATALSTLTSTVNTQGNSITSNSTAITNLENTVNDTNTGVAATASALSSLTTTVTNQGNTLSSQATSISNLSSSVGTANANITNLQTAVTDIEDNANAAYVLQVEANGAVAGMVLEANADAGTGSSAIQFQADKFAIWDGSGAASSNSVAPFIVDSGVVFIDTARIKDGSIQAAKIGSLNADVITTGGMSAARINAGTMSADRISGGSISGTHISAGTLSIAGTAISGSVGKIDAFVTNSTSIYEYGELFRSAFNTSGRPHIADTTVTTGNDSGETGNIPSITAGSSILGIEGSFTSPPLVHQFTTFNWGSGTRPFTIAFSGNINGSSTAGDEEIVIAMVMRATSSATDYTSTSGYVATTSKSAEGSSLVLGSHYLAMKADLNPNQQYYIWVFVGVDDLAGSVTLSDALVSVQGLNA